MEMEKSTSLYTKPEILDNSPNQATNTKGSTVQNPLLASTLQCLNLNGAIHYLCADPLRGFIITRLGKGYEIRSPYFQGSE